MQLGDRFPVEELGLPERSGAPGRAPMHSHSYDEVVYVIDGEGTLHFGGRETPIGPGSAMHLPPLVEHCLENTGKGSMRVLGVFHPSGDPASRATESE
jgi:mannose-6-phosphate isomerase-like protein (cupin superfamily)